MKSSARSMENIKLFKIQKYLQIFNLAIIHTLKDYKGLVALSIFMTTCLVIFAHLWKIAAAKSGAINLDPNQLLWFIAFNEWVLISIPDVQLDIEQDLRSGRLAYLLLKPLSYLGATFFEAAGTLWTNLIALGAVGFTFTWIKTGILPFEAFYFIPTILLGFLAGCVGLIFQMLVGISAFWTQEVGPFNWIWEKLLFILGGLILPLTVYPKWLQDIAYMTPFPFILGARSALVFDHSLYNFLWITCSIIGWSVLGFLCLFVLYRRGLQILNIEGG